MIVDNIPTRLLSPSQRASLAGDQGLSCGNFFDKVYQLSSCPDAPHFWLERAFYFDGIRYDTLSLTLIDRIVARVALWYRDQGVGPVDPVVVYIDNDVDYFIHYLALLRLGAIGVLVNGELDGESVCRLAGRVQAVGVVCDEKRVAAVAGLAGEIRFVVRQDAIYSARELEGAEKLVPYEHEDDDPVLLTHSSGTTGQPKAVALQNRGFFHGVRYRLRMPVAEGAGRILCALPCAHNSAITLMSYALVNGLPLMIAADRSGASVLACIEQFRPSMVSAFPSTYVELCNENLDAHDLSSVGLWYNSGDAAHEKHVRRLVHKGSHRSVSRSGVEIRSGSLFIDGLGSSEMGHSLFHNRHTPETNRFGRCVGKPLAWVEAAVLDDAGHPLADGQIGRLGVRAPTVTPGYWNDSGLTWKSKAGGYWLTGDVVYRGEDGYYYHLDRVSDVVYTEKGKVYTCQCEEVILGRVEGLEDCTVVGVGEDRNLPWVFLQPESTHQHVDEARWLTLVNEALASESMLPVVGARCVGAGSLPIGVTGKVKKRELRDRCGSLLADKGAVSVNPGR